MQILATRVRPRAAGARKFVNKTLRATSSKPSSAWVLAHKLFGGRKLLADLNLLKKVAGYSLIELMVVVGISSLLSLSIVAVLSASSQGQRATQRSSQEQASTTNIFKTLYQSKSCDIEGDTDLDKAFDASENENPEAFFMRPSFKRLMALDALDSKSNGSVLQKNDAIGASVIIPNSQKISQYLNTSPISQSNLSKNLDLGRMGQPDALKEQAAIQIGGQTLTQGEVMPGHASICVGSIILRLPFDSEKYKNKKCTGTGSCPIVTMFRTPTDYITQCDGEGDPAHCRNAPNYGCQFKISQGPDSTLTLPTAGDIDTKTECEGHPNNTDASTENDLIWRAPSKWLPGYKNSSVPAKSNSSNKYSGYRYDLALEITLYHVQKWSEKADGNAWTCRKIMEADPGYLDFGGPLPDSIKIKKLKIPLTIHDTANALYNSCQSFYKATPSLCPTKTQNPIVQVIKNNDGSKSFQAVCPTHSIQDKMSLGHHGSQITLYGGTYSKDLNDLCNEGNPQVQIAWGSTATKLEQLTDHKMSGPPDSPPVLSPDDYDKPDKVKAIHLTNDCTGGVINADASSIRAQPSTCNQSKVDPTDKVKLCACPKGYGTTNDFDVTATPPTSNPKGKGNQVFSIDGEKNPGFDTENKSAGIKTFQCVKIIATGDAAKERTKDLCLNGGFCSKPPMICTQYCLRQCADKPSLSPRPAYIPEVEELEGSDLTNWTNNRNSTSNCGTL